MSHSTSDGSDVADLHKPATSSQYNMTQLPYPRDNFIRKTSRYKDVFDKQEAAKVDRQSFQQAVLTTLKPDIPRSGSEKAAKATREAFRQAVLNSLKSASSPSDSKDGAKLDPQAPTFAPGPSHK
ncbi:hypothetical protein EJ08DRAFT_326960 [Tothia fuscella]|uniref:Uncharacterized protein n=1 Tax=Tothia fuscella TaxID=1048955 RepID=A0A9P4NN50_9PEZI|nr:hypothetical protein EJ08DRAFT_326960 [Tothia fuscella]